MAPEGATLKLTGSVPSVLGGPDLLCICDMAKGYNTDAQAFVAGLAPDLSDFELTEADEVTPVPWRRPDSSVFSQAVGSEMLYVMAKPAGTDINAWAGCTAPTGEDAGSAVVSEAHVIYMPGVLDGANWENWTGVTVPRAGGTEDAAGLVGAGIRGSGSKVFYTADAQGDLGMDFSSAGPGYTYIYNVFGDYDVDELSGIHSGAWGFSHAGGWKFRYTYALGEFQNYFYMGPYGGTKRWHSVIATMDPAAMEMSIYRNTELCVTDPNLTFVDVTVGLAIGGNTYQSYEDILTGIVVDEVAIIEGAWSGATVGEYATMINDPGSWFVVDGPAEAALSAYYPATRRPLIYRAGPRMIGGT